MRRKEQSVCTSTTGRWRKTQTKARQRWCISCHISMVHLTSAVAQKVAVMTASQHFWQHAMKWWKATSWQWSNKQLQLLYGFWLRFLHSNRALSGPRVSVSVFALFLCYPLNIQYMMGLTMNMVSPLQVHCVFTHECKCKQLLTFNKCHLWVHISVHV